MWSTLHAHATIFSIVLFLLKQHYSNSCFQLVHIDNSCFQLVHIDDKRLHKGWFIYKISSNILLTSQEPFKIVESK
jgi:hypothetical protein